MISAVLGASVLLAPVALGRIDAAGAAPISAAPAASATPNALLQNNQVVTVGWSGLPPTSLTLNPFTQYRNNDVAILECTATPPDGFWYFFRDCYTQGENLGGNIVAPSAGVQASEIPLAGSTGPTGAGSYPFQVQEGTLQTQEVQFPCSTAGQTSCNRPYDVQCDIAHACVLKVVALPNGAPPIPNELWQGPPTPTQDVACAANPLACSYTQLLDAAPAIPLDFAPIPNCPAITAGNLAIEGDSSASYALESWAAALCTGSSPITISYSAVSDDAAKAAFLARNTTIGVASLSPTAAQINAAVAPPAYLAAPLAASGVSIVFNMVDPLTGLPIGCSANQPVSQCAMPVRLTPRLVAMLITNSATVNAQEPFGHYGVSGTSRFIQPLTADPEFRALNPGFQPPGICAVRHHKTRCADNVEEPVLRAEQLDDTYTLTRWIADDLDARMFLAGADPCGAKLNRDWQGVTYPAVQFQELARTTSGTTPDSDSYYPVDGISAVLQALLYGVPVGGPPPAPGSPKNWLPAPTDNYAFFGVMDTVSAHRSGLPSAQLIAANANGSELNALVTEHRGRCTPIRHVSPWIRGRRRRRPGRRLPGHDRQPGRHPGSSGHHHGARRLPAGGHRLRVRSDERDLARHRRPGGRPAPLQRRPRSDAEVPPAGVLPPADRVAGRGPESGGQGGGGGHAAADQDTPGADPSGRSVPVVDTGIGQCARGRAGHRAGPAGAGCCGGGQPGGGGSAAAVVRCPGGVLRRGRRPRRPDPAIAPIGTRRGGRRPALGWLAPAGGRSRRGGCPGHRRCDAHAGSTGPAEGLTWP